MCAFHNLRQSGSLFDRKRGKRRHMCFSRLTTSFVHGEKNTKVSEWGRTLLYKELGKFGEVVLKGLVPENATRVRFKEVRSKVLVWERLGKRKNSCFWGGHRL